MRRTAFIALFVVAVAAIGWTWAWFLIAARIDERVAVWAEARRAEGLTVDYADLRVGGFPFSWRVTIDRPALTGAGATQWRWRGAAVHAELRPWATNDIRLEFPGEHRFAGGAGGLALETAIQAERPDARVVLAPDGEIDLLALDLGGVELRLPADAAPVRAARATFSLRLHRVPDATYRTDTLDAVILFEGVRLPATPFPSLGDQIARFYLQSRFKGRLTPGSFAEAVERWRDDGGAIELDRLSLIWGPFEFDGDGTLALDGENRPLGAFTARLRGYGEALDAMAATGIIRPFAAAGTKIALNVLARQPGQPGDGRVSVALAAQDGQLYVANVPLLRLAPLSFE
ncbi:MAG: DUF2125 domain-containing protein [Rhodospirillales bacterium]|nr:DUF2125 domain-containing protein [Rhodospirillales bacterium]